VGPDGPTHHGSFDTVYVRSLPNFTVMSPGDALDLPLMIDFATTHPGPTAIRYPKEQAERVEREVQPLELGRAETLHWGADGMLIAYGSSLSTCVRVAERLRGEGLDVGVINARFAKPLDEETILRAVSECGFVMTVEEGTLAGGFGSAVLEAANEAQLDVRRLRRLGLPDRYVLHAEREEQLQELGLDEAGIYRQACGLAQLCGLNREHSRA
jgi:1-deoxy-D-xylulose-5-phosphate synthase